MCRAKISRTITITTVFSQECQQDRGTEMLVSILNTVWSSPPCYKTEYLTPGTDIPSSPGQRAVRHVDRGRERQQQPQQVSERDRLYRERKRGGLAWENSQSISALWGVRHEDVARRGECVGGRVLPERMGVEATNSKAFLFSQKRTVWQREKLMAEL